MREAGGLIWGYFGPKDREPAFPDYAFMQAPAALPGQLAKAEGRDHRMARNRLDERDQRRHVAQPFELRVDGAERGWVAGVGRVVQVGAATGSRLVQVTVADGTFEAHVVVPDQPNGAGIVVIQDQGEARFGLIRGTDWLIDAPRAAETRLSTEASR